MIVRPQIVASIGYVVGVSTLNSLSVATPSRGAPPVTGRVGPEEGSALELERGLNTGSQGAMNGDALIAEKKYLRSPNCGCGPCRGYTGG
tara:strand:- start:1480 stop:1749 length:270 start_codon:yes stop_codon:yes gene_type:complete